MTMTLKQLTLLAAAMFVATSSADSFAAKSKSSEWYLSTTIQVTHPGNGKQYDGDNPVVIGKLAASSDGYDMHDLRPYNSLGSAKAAVVIVQSDWGDDSGQYLSDYHSTKGSNDTWVFTVVSTVPNAEVSLQWDGLFDLTPVEYQGRLRYLEEKQLDNKTLKDLTLIDLETLEMIPAVSNGQLNNYNFALDGAGTRNFKWVLGPVKKKHFADNYSSKEAIREARWADKQNALKRQNNKDKNDRFPPMPGEN